MSAFELSRRSALAGLGLGVVSLAGLAGGCSPKATAPAKAATVRLRQEWIANSGFAGEVLAATRFAPKRGVNLQVREGGEAIDPIRSVLSGEDEMGVVAGDILISAIARGAPIVAVGMANDVSPTCFLSLKTKGIRTPADFAGKRVGVLQGTNTEKIYQIMMKRNNIDRRKIREVVAPFEVTSFIAGEYDVRPGFIYDEPVTLSNAKVDFDVLQPADFGVTFIGTVYFTTKKFLQDHRDQVVPTLAALKQGWDEVATKPGQDAAIVALKAAFPKVDEARERQCLERGAGLFRGPGGQPLKATEAHITDTIRGLEELGEIKAGQVAVASVWDPKPLEEAYASLAS